MGRREGKKVVEKAETQQESYHRLSIVYREKYSLKDCLRQSPLLAHLTTGWQSQT